MAFQLNKVFTPLTKALSVGSSATRKKTFKYKVTLKGTQISKHYTLKAAKAASSKVRGAKVGKLTKKKY